MMGVVYEAHDPVLGRDIALKVIQLAFSVTDEDRQGFQKRFFAEARTAAHLSHPGILVVHDVGQDQGTEALFMALELLRGRTLDQIIKEQAPIDWRESLRIVRLVAEALHHAHSQGVIHRDIKPANIMLLSSGEPKIMDFGIAKVEASQLTAAGQLFGTPLYMSPEQALAHPVDGRSDLFALGSLLYEMLTGRPAFAGENVTKILFQVVSREPQPATELLPTLPEGVEYVLSRCLAKDVAQRYPNGRSLADDVEDILAGRPPRSRDAWQPPAAALKTMVASAPPALSASRSPEQPAPGGGPTGSKKPLLFFAIAGAAVLAIVLAVFLVGRGSEPSLSPIAWRVSPTPVPSRDAPPPTVAESGARDQDTATSPEGGAASDPAKAGEPARLLIDFEHSLKSGALRVWVDDTPVVEERLGGRVTKDIVGIQFRKGRHSDTLELTPGRHEVRVQVSWDDNFKTESIWGRFQPGSTRRLKAKLGGLGGLRKSLSLEWSE